LALCGSAVLVWVHASGSQGIGANLAPLVWCAIGVALLVRPAQPLVVSAASLGMAGLATHGVLAIVWQADMDLWRPVDAIRIALWIPLAAAALPAAVGEALPLRPVLARRLYFVAVALFFLEGGLRRALEGATRNPSEAVFFFVATGIAVLGIGTAGRAVTPDPVSFEPGRAPLPPAEETGLPGDRLPRRPVRYLDEAPPRGETSSAGG
jgi:hypothetical protein